MNVCILNYDFCYILHHAIKFVVNLDKNSKFIVNLDENSKFKMQSVIFLKKKKKMQSVIKSII